MRSTLLSSRSTHFFRLYNGVNPSGVRHIFYDMISQVSLSRDDVVFAVLEVPVSLQICFLARGELSYHQDVNVPLVGPRTCDQKLTPCLSCSRFLFGCAASLYLTGLWNVCGWMLMSMLQNKMVLQTCSLWRFGIRVVFFVIRVQQRTVEPFPQDAGSGLSRPTILLFVVVVAMRKEILSPASNPTISTVCVLDG